MCLTVSPMRRPFVLPMQGISGAIHTYIQLHDRPAGGQAQEEEALLAGMSAEEQKRWERQAGGGWGGPECPHCPADQLMSRADMSLMYCLGWLYCRYRQKKRKEEQRKAKEAAEAAAKEAVEAAAAAAKKGDKGEERKKK